jgi:hypothetical protein
MSSIINATLSNGLSTSADNSGEIELQSNGTTALKVNTNEGIQILNCLGVGNATPSTSGAGITFPATQSASSDANTLDDYEEGTFSPTIFSGFTSPTYGNQTGYYTKIGNVVTFAFRLYVNGGTRNGSTLAFSLPFLAKTTGTQTGPASWAYVNTSIVNSTSTNLPTLYIDTNTTIMYCYKTDSNSFAGTDLAGTTPDMYISGTYLTA